MHRDAWEDDDESTIPCPHCGRQVYEDSERCPYCENYLSAEDAPPAAKPVWIIVATVLCLAAILTWIIGGF